MSVGTLALLYKGRPNRTFLCASAGRNLSECSPVPSHSVLGSRESSRCSGCPLAIPLLLSLGLGKGVYTFLPEPQKPEETAVLSSTELPL